MKKTLLTILQLAAIIGLGSGCAIRTFDMANGTKITSYNFLWMSSAQSISVTTNSLKVTKYSGESDKEALAMVVQAAVEGAIKGAK